MSVTIVSALPKATAAASNEAAVAAQASGETASGPADFLSLFLALGGTAGLATQNQATTLASTTLASTTLAPTHQSASQSDVEKDAESKDDSLPDIVDLLAVMGAIPTEVRADKAPGTSPPRTSVATDSSVPETGKTALPSQAQLPSPVSAQSLTEDLATNALPEGLTDTAADFLASVGTKTAKIAVADTAASGTETTAIRETTTQQTAPAAAALAQDPLAKTNAPAHDTTLSVRTPVREAGWSQDFAQKIVWMATNDKQSAQITLNPPQLGPIEVSLNIDKGTATATFSSANAEVRETIETAMPRLREMFASAGIELGQANVSAESYRQAAEQQNKAWSGRSADRDSATSVAAVTGPVSSGTYTRRVVDGLVDTFA